MNEENSENSTDNTMKGIFSDMTWFYIGEHLNTF